MELAFEKMHGLGNDFAVFEDWDARVELAPDQVARLCDRHTGIGADGLIFVRPSDAPGCRAFMHYLNSDGTLAQMCGNGVRCFAKYLVDHGFVDPARRQVDVETRAGTRRISFDVDAAGKLVRASVDMGRPVLDPAQVPTRCPADATTPEGQPYAGAAEIASPWGPFRFACVSMGNPHAVCFVDSWDDLPDELFFDPDAKCLDGFDVARVGAFFEAHPLFPEKTNVEFVEARPEGLAMRVWERGCGETLACGTGACAVAVAAMLSGRAEGEADVMPPGGTLRIRWADDGHVVMTGPAASVYTGTVEVPQR